MNPTAANARDAGLRLISKLNRWTIAGAVALAGMISIAAEKSFHGRTAAVASSIRVLAVFELVGVELEFDRRLAPAACPATLVRSGRAGVLAGRLGGLVS